MHLILCVSMLPMPSAEAGRAVESAHGMVVAVSAPAAEVGASILKRGGSAVDAAVAVALAMAVTFPEAGNIGGGGFMMIAGPSVAPTCIEYRETAPAAATADMFAAGRDQYSARAVGVPGTLRGLELAHKKYGKLPWRDLVLPAVKLAAEGFVVDPRLASSLNALIARPGANAELVRVFGRPQPWKPGDTLVQPDLAATLKLVADRGADAFYAGPVADRIVADMQLLGGLITKADLANYQARERKPIHGTYRGYDVYGPPPPSSGGIVLVQMLNVLENFNLREAGRESPATIHRMAEVMRRGYLDRARHLGDADFVDIPAHLTDKAYARKLAESIQIDRATRSDSLAADLPLADDGGDTTHFSVIDRDGLAVSNTYTLERSFGSQIVVRGAGFFLNNEMLDFNPVPGVTRRDGQIGTAANLVAPGKRMLSSQTPTVVMKNGQVYLVTGSPGSRTIINTVLCVITNMIDHDMDVQSAVDAPRMHHGWMPDKLSLEKPRQRQGLAIALRMMGHEVVGDKQGDAHTIWVDPKTGRFFGAADRRILGAAVGY